MANAEEAVARVLYARHGHKYSSPVVEWDALEPKFRESWLADARLVIEAVAPYFSKQGATLEAVDMAKIQRPTFGVHLSRGKDAADSFYLGDDEAILNWILDSAEQGVAWDSLEDEPTHALIQLNLPNGYYYWNGIFFHIDLDWPDGLYDISDAKSTVTVTAEALFDDKAYIATMGLEEVTPKEFYNADLPSNKIISANG